MKIKIISTGLLAIALMWMAIIIQEGWEISVEMVTNVLYQKVEYVPINVPKISTLPLEAKIRHLWGKEAKMAISIAKAENSRHICDLEVLEPNGTKSYGIFQINSVHLKKGYTVSQLKDCDQNILIAKSIYDKSGWSLWSSYKNQAYKKYLIN